MSPEKFNEYKFLAKNITIVYSSSHIQMLKLQLFFFSLSGNTFWVQGSINFLSLVFVFWSIDTTSFPPLTVWETPSCRWSMEGNNYYSRFWDEVVRIATPHLFHWGILEVWTLGQRGLYSMFLFKKNTFTYKGNYIGDKIMHKKIN